MAKYRKKLTLILQNVPQFPEPKAYLEQYVTPASICADILLFALELGDIKGKKVIDLGSGTGIFSIGARILGAKEVISIDIDKKAVDVARGYAHTLGIEINFLVSDIKEFNDKGDTVIQNPPFGSQRRHADVPFLKKAGEVGRVVYSIHRTPTERFIRNLASELNMRITHEKRLKLGIKHMYPFHRMVSKDVESTLFRFEREDIYGRNCTAW